MNIFNKKTTLEKLKLFIVIITTILGIYFILSIIVLVINYTFDTNIDIGGITHNKINTENKHINFLLAGIGGEGHEGPNLTDTIIFATYNYKYKSLSMLSIPRDFFYKDKIFANKINEIYSILLYNKDPDPIGNFTKVIENIVGKKIDYTLIVDFKGFVEFIDNIGGVTIDVENSFTDYMYPTDNYKWKTVSFKAGMQTMNGKRALEYVRSRHAEGIEGSDFARSRRQQKMIQAIYEQLISTSILFNPVILSDIYTTFKNNIQTNISINDIFKLAQIAKNLDKSNIYIYTLTDNIYDFLFVPPKEIQNKLYNGMYVLLPIGGNYDKIKQLVNVMYNYPLIKKENVNIAILNTTKNANYGFECMMLLNKYGLNIKKNKNIKVDTIPELSYIYDNYNQKNTQSIQALHMLLKDISISKFTDIKIPNSFSGSVILILGKDNICNINNL